MIKTPIKAIAKSDSIIEIVSSKDFYISSVKKFILFEDGKEIAKLTPVSQSESTTNYIYTLMVKNFHYVCGHNYEIETADNYFIPIDISFITLTDAFEKKYRYDGKLGALYTKEATTFRLFTPLANRVILLLKKNGEEKEEAYVLNHDIDKGIFEITIAGDLDKARYKYVVTLMGNTIEVTDPYSFSLSSNALYSYVIDLEKIKAISTNRECLKDINKDEAIIYECNIRDLTSLTNNPNKGTFQALLDDSKTKANLPMGISYLASLGVTHIQFQPLLDFQSINEDDRYSNYNWGYDPAYYFAVEGSYDIYPDDPYSRAISLRKVISKMHKEGLRVINDVVYNHVFSMDFNALNLLLPSYYFRYNNDKTLSTGSGCGNDLETRHYMCRKLIVDSILHQIDVFDIDGFRFDLMGIIDIDTLKEIKDKAFAAKKDVILYGEGWDLATNLPFDQKGSMLNSSRLPDYSFFNDRFRDVVKGKTNESEIRIKGYLLGDTNYLDGFKHVFLGSTTPIAFAPLFERTIQSINYVECHDNHTLFDKIKLACDESDEMILKRINIINTALLMAVGIPFIHMGQEIGLSKGGNGNSYNAGDKVNGFDYSILDKRKNMYRFFVDAVDLRKKMIKLANGDYSRLEQDISFENLDYGAVKVNYNFDNGISMFAIFNPTNQKIMYNFDDYVQLIFNETGNVENNELYVKMAIINAISVNVFVKKAEKEN